ncbi:hypothetical protein WR25_14618 [Diploscapter pachys]|uniref:Uncharacterized protein n=1 Tax=Diploscapter pachys TaxID=2018661 RepID=A0A2A2LSS9_9BILA|nr:hypothetical protein WR25_14618 [Diploscapter pachys]
MREFTGITEEQFDVIADYVTQADKSKESRFRSTIDYIEQEIYNPFDENPPAFAKDRALLILNMANYAIDFYDATKLVFDLRRDTAPPMVLAMLYAERFYDLPRHTPDNRDQMIKINCEALSKIAKDVEDTLYVAWPGAEKEEDPIEKDGGGLSSKESSKSKFKSLSDKDNDRLSESSQINKGRIGLDKSDTQLFFVSANQTELSKEENASGDKEDGKSSQEEDFDHTKINEFFSIMNNAWIASHSGVLEENLIELVAQQQNTTEKDAPEKSALDEYPIMAPIDAHIELSRIKSEKSPSEQAQPEEATLDPVNTEQQTIAQQSIGQQTFPTEAPPPIVFGPDLSKLPPSEQDTSKQGAMIPNSAERFSDRITFDDNLLGF